MAWPPPPTIPDDPVVAGWWRNQERRSAGGGRPETSPVLDRPEWVVPALAARARRTIRDIDEALGGPPRQRKGPLVFDDASQRWIPETSVDSRHTRPAPDHGVAARYAGPIEHGHYPGARVLSVR
jgi:hypothetical protein